MDTIVIVSGGFDPVHKGHIEMFQEAAKFGKVVLALNSDQWLINKKGKYFMDWEERKAILSEMKSIFDIIAFEDDKMGSACNAIREVVKKYANDNTKIIFANGGDRTHDNKEKNIMSDIALCKELEVEIVYNIGKSGKIQSSSELTGNYGKK